MPCGRLDTLHREESRIPIIVIGLWREWKRRSVLPLRAISVFNQHRSTCILDHVGVWIGWKLHSESQSPISCLPRRSLRCHSFFSPGLHRLLTLNYLTAHTVYQGLNEVVHPKRMLSLRLVMKCISKVETSRNCRSWFAALAGHRSTKKWAAYHGGMRVYLRFIMIIIMWLYIIIISTPVGYRWSAEIVGKWLWKLNLRKSTSPGQANTLLLQLSQRCVKPCRTEDGTEPKCKHDLLNSRLYNYIGS